MKCFIFKQIPLTSLIKSIWQEVKRVCKLISCDGEVTLFVVQERGRGILAIMDFIWRPRPKAVPFSDCRHRKKPRNFTN